MNYICPKHYFLTNYNELTCSLDVILGDKEAFDLPSKNNVKKLNGLKR